MRTNKIVILSLLLVCLLSTTSCLSIITKVFFNKDGGGTYTFNMDFSQMGKMLGPEFGEKLKEDMEKDQDMTNRFDQMAKGLSEIDGISGFDTGLNPDEVKMYFTFKFDNTEALNQALAYAFNKEDAPINNEPFFKWDGKSLERTSRALFAGGSITDMMGEDEAETEQMEEMMAMFARDSFFEVLIEFENKIKKFDNDDYEKVDDHTLRWKQFATDEADKGMKQEVTVRLK